MRRFRLAFNLAASGPDVLDRLLQLLAAYPGAGKQVQDAKRVATMLAHGVRRLLTSNAADFRCFGRAIALEPMGAPS